MLLYFAARAQNFDERILAGLGARRRRSVRSIHGFDAGVSGRRPRNSGPDVVMQLHNIACHGLQPDLTICIDIDAETGLERATARTGANADRMEEQAIEFHQRVREIYLELARQYPERIKIIDGRGSASRRWLNAFGRSVKDRV